MLTVAILGLGSRGIGYAKLTNRRKDCKFTAFCDKDERKLTNAVEALHCKDVALYTDDNEFFAAGKLADVLYICTQDRDHYEQAMKALELGYHILLEKPVSPNPLDCITIAKKAEEVGKKVFVCHVLRYSSFYRTIKKILDDGSLGDLMLVQHNEHIGYWHFAHSYVRGNWRREEETTPMLMAKCCHDMDLLYWWLGTCKTASSLGGLSYFKAENAPEGAAKYCKDCPHQETCNYYSKKQYMSVDGKAPQFPWGTLALTPEADAASIEKAALEGPYGRCVFHSDNDVCDHQTAQLCFEHNGKEVPVQFSVSAFSNQCYRSSHFFGTKGELWGDDDSETITLHLFGQEPKVITLSLADQSVYGGGHAGGDVGMVNDVLDLLLGKEVSAAGLTTIQETAESHLIVDACEKSRKNGGALVEVHKII